MKAAVLEAFNEPLVIKQVEYPKLQPDGVILKLEATGVCRSDLHGWSGHLPVKGLPHILGHEMSGVVEEVGKDIRNFKKGDRVIVPFSQGDGTCPYCQSGHNNICEDMRLVGFHFDGGFAEYIHIPDADFNLLHLPENIDFVTASAMGCRFMTAFHGVVSRGNICPGEWVSVYGSGGVGLSAIQIASAAGANVIAVDIADDKLEFAKQMGAVATVNSKETNAPEAIKEITKGGANFSIDALGINDTFLNSILSLNKHGRHLQLGMSSNPNGGMTPLPINLILLNELTLVGSVGMPVPEFRQMLQMVERGKIDPGKLVTKQIALDDINEAFEDMTKYSGFGVSVITKF